jgi:chemotaxis protein histidine kinase CheA
MTGFSLRSTTVLCLASIALGCGADLASRPMAAREATSDGRKVAKTAELSVEVADPEKAAAEVERVVSGEGGFVERSTAEKDAKVWLTCRVPAAQLDRLMDAIAALGTEESRSTTTLDVTDQYADLDTRLRNAQAVRGRLQELLSRAKDVSDVLAIEKELTRIQSEIETLQGQLDRLKSEISLSALSVTLEPKHVLGPLGYLGYGLFWGIAKLFVLW